MEGQGRGCLGGGGPEGGFQDPFFSSASTIQGSGRLGQLCPQFHQGAGLGRGGVGSGVEGCSGAGSPNAGVLQPSLRGVEGLGSLAPHHRFVYSEQVCGGDQVQDGDGSVGLGLGSSRGLDGLTGPEGRLPSGPDASGEQEVPSFFHREGNFSVQGPSFWTDKLSPGFHSGDGSGVCHAPLYGHKDAEISGRLADPGNQSCRMSTVEGQGTPALSGVGDSHQSREIPIVSHSDCDVPGVGDKLDDFEGFTNLSPDSDIIISRQRVPLLREAACLSLEKVVRPSLIPDSVSARRALEDEILATVVKKIVGLSRRRGTDRMGPSGSVRPEVVVGVRSTSTRVFARGGPPGPDVLVRRLGRGLGSTPGGHLRFRPLVGGRQDSIHQPQGAQGYSSGSGPFRGSTGREDSGSLLGQFDLSSIYQETGRHHIPCPEQGGSVNSALGRATRDDFSSSVHLGSSQRVGRRAVSKEPDHRVRMDSRPGCGGQAGEEVAGHGGSLCHVHQLPSPCVLCPDQRPSECRDRCVPSGLEQSAGLCLSAVFSGSSGPQQVEGLDQHRDNVDRSVLASEGVVSGLAGVPCGTTPSVTRTEGSTQTAPLPSLPSGAPSAKPSCLETIQRFARHEGFSRRVAEQVSLARRKSTRLVYQAKWDIYRQWCREKGHSISRPSLPKVADFLLYLHEVKKLSVSGIRGYRSMLSLVFRWKLPDLSSSSVIKDLIRSFYIQRPVRRISPPEWDLDVVLRALRSPPYEPLGEATFRDLTKKTLFLLALATSKRIGEIQSLSYRVARQGGDLSLSYLPGFVAKTETERNPIPRHFILKSLKEFVGDLEDDALLCPVRAIKFYMAATRDLSPRPSHLFVSPRCRHKAITKNAISFFLRECISGAGALRADEGRGPRAHSIRGVSTSVTFYRNWSLKQVLNAATWRSNSTFAAFYLRDVSYTWENCRSLGPFVSAGQVVNTSELD